MSIVGKRKRVDNGIEMDGRCKDSREADDGSRTWKAGSKGKLVHFICEKLDEER